MVFTVPKGKPISGLTKADVSAIVPGGKVKSKSEPNTEFDIDMSKTPVTNPKDTGSESEEGKPKPGEKGEPKPGQKPTKGSGTSKEPGEKGEPKPGEGDDSGSGSEEGEPKPGEKKKGSSGKGSGTPKEPGEETEEGEPKPGEGGTIPPKKKDGSKGGIFDKIKDALGIPHKHEDEEEEEPEESKAVDPTSKFSSSDMNDLLDKIRGIAAEDPAQEKPEEEQKPEEERGVVEPGDKKAEDVADTIISDAVKAVADAIRKDTGGNPPDTITLDKLMGSLGAAFEDGVGESLKNMKGNPLSTDWRDIFKTLIRKAIGTREEYSSATPSRRIEDQFGRDVDKPAMKKVVLSFDCSGSMGVRQFLAVMKEITELSKMSFARTALANAEIWAFFWSEGLQYANVKTNIVRLPGKGFKPGFETQLVALQTKAHLRGSSTNFNTNHCVLLQTLKQFDMLIVMTDGVFNDNGTNEEQLTIKKLVSRLARMGRIVWVLTGYIDKSKIQAIDPQYSKRAVILKGAEGRV